MVNVPPDILALAGLGLMTLGWLAGWIMRGHRECDHWPKTTRGRRNLDTDDATVLR